MFGIRGLEWIILLVIILLIFGPSKIPALAKSIGKSITEFRKGVKSVGKKSVESTLEITNSVEVTDENQKA